MTLLRTYLDVILTKDADLLVFAHRQMRLLDGSSVLGCTSRVTRGPGTITLQVDKKLSAGLHRLEVVYEGLPPIFVDGKILDEITKKQEQTFEPDSRLLVRLDLINKYLDEAIHPLANALARFDHATDWTGLTATLFDEARSIGTILMNRVVRRAGWSAAARPMPAATIHEFPASLLSVETAFRNALDVFHDNGKTGFDQEFFTQAFAGFVGSEFALRTAPGDYPEPALKFAGVPDSAMFFCFAEAAICFIQLGHDVPFWRWLLRHFVAGARTLTDWYWDGGKRDRDAYSGGALPVALPRTNHLQLVERLPEDSDSLIEIFGGIVCDALADELVGVTCGAGRPPAERVAVKFTLLCRAGPPATHQSEPLPGAEEPKFDNVSKLHADLLCGLLAGGCDDPLALVDDPAYQESLLARYVSRRFETTSTKFDGRPVKVNPCAGKPSTWNPKTKQCDPPRVGAALRFKIVETRSGDGSGAQTSIDGEAKDTDFEILVATSNNRA